MKSFSSFIWGLMFIVCTVVFSVQAVALDPDFYTSRYEKMDMAANLDVSKTDLNQSIEVLLDYINDTRSDMDLKITRDGVAKEAFNEKEKMHMVDVKALYQNAIKVMIICFIGLLVILFYFGLKEKEKLISFLTKGFLQAMICLMIVLIFFGFWVAYDFTGFWTWFHTIFFTNDLWLLNPATDFMICMLPEIIFNQLVLNITLMVIFILVPVTLFSIYYQFKKAPIGFDRK